MLLPYATFGGPSNIKNDESGSVCMARADSKDRYHGICTFQGQYLVCSVGFALGKACLPAKRGRGCSTKFGCSSVFVVSRHGCLTLCAVLTQGPRTTGVGVCTMWCHAWPAYCGSTCLLGGAVHVARCPLLNCVTADALFDPLTAMEGVGATCRQFSAGCLL